MDNARVHFEVFVRKKPGSSWSLEMATENRALAMTTAEDLVKEGHVVAAKVTKETLDEETREFQTVSILNVGTKEAARKPAIAQDLEPLCVTPQDLYTVHARDRIGQLLEAWLNRNRATPFELLHRPDLIETLEAAGSELQHAIQKIAVPEAQARGRTVHDLMRTFHALVQRAIDRVMRDSRKGVLPDIDKEGFAVCCVRLARDPEGTYLVGAGVAASIAPARSWTEKINRLLDLADGAPAEGAPRKLAVAVLEQPLAEILVCRPGLDDILGKGMDLGGDLAALTRLAACEAVEALIGIEPSVAKVMPPLSPGAKRLAAWLGAEDFADVRTALGKRILRELNGPRRLRPTDAAGEIDVLRGLAMSLTAAAGKLLPLEDVQSAFSARSKMLVTGDFVEAYLGPNKTAREEAEALVWLAENVIGPANKRLAARWLAAVISSLRFDQELKTSAETPANKLAALAALQRAVGRCGLMEEDRDPIQAKLGAMGGTIEADAKLTASIAKAGAPAVHRLTLLLRLASGEAAPLGPAADRARVEALKLVRHDDTRAELSQAPDQAGAVRDLIQQAGLAA
ncbi:MAG: hypothetical protein ABI655_08960 [Phenylobacterium sp.]